MKQKIKVKLFNDLCMPVINEKGDAIDLCAACQIDKDTLVSQRFLMIPLGIAMQLPKGMSAYVYPRSGTFKKYGIVMTNSVGIIDGSYCGDNDQWHFPAFSLMKRNNIDAGDRICQFVIRPSMTATLWQKLKWMLTTKYEFVQVDSLGNDDRGGFGSTGK